MVKPGQTMNMCDNSTSRGSHSIFGARAGVRVAGRSTVRRAAQSPPPQHSCGPRRLSLVVFREILRPSADRLAPSSPPQLGHRLIRNPLITKSLTRARPSSANGFSMPFDVSNADAFPWAGEPTPYPPDDDQDLGSGSNLLLGGSPSEAALANLFVGSGWPDNSSGTGRLNFTIGDGSDWDALDPGPSTYWNASAPPSSASPFDGSIDWAGGPSGASSTDSIDTPNYLDLSEYVPTQTAGISGIYPALGSNYDQNNAEYDANNNQGDKFSDSEPLTNANNDLTDDSEATPTFQNVAYVVKRESPRTTRGRWERANGRLWPRDEMGRNYHVSHKQALADEGTNDLSNVEPKHPDEHMREHKENGDFKRWRARRGGKAPTPAQPQESDPIEEAEAPPTQSGPQSGPAANPSPAQHPPPPIHGLLPFMRLTPWGVFWSTLLQADPAY